jgi:hypothetical protein
MSSILDYYCFFIPALMQGSLQLNQTKWRAGYQTLLLLSHIWPNKLYVF